MTYWNIIFEASQNPSWKHFANYADSVFAAKKD
jgi:hypothetical protein